MVISVQLIIQRFCIFRCKKKEYINLPKASVIICFYNEHFKTLLRTVHSVLNESPENLLEEIILIDDMSDLDNLHEEIELYIKMNTLAKVKLIKAERREGLIRARLLGARKANGKVKINIFLSVFDIMKTLNMNIF